MDGATGTVKATGRDGVTREFAYSLSEDTQHCNSFDDARKTRTFQVPSTDGRAMFQASFMEEVDCWKVIMLSHDSHKEFVAMGLPEAFIREAAKIFGKRVRSSSNEVKTEASESRNPTATKVWLRLVAGKEATYDENTDNYWYCL